MIPTCGEKKERTKNRSGVECDHIVSDFHVWSYPATIIIDKKGVVRHVNTGFMSNPVEQERWLKVYKDIIDGLLAE